MSMGTLCILPLMLAAYIMFFVKRVKADRGEGGGGGGGAEEEEALLPSSRTTTSVGRQTDEADRSQ